jgi:hypothetical protein
VDFPEGWSAQPAVQQWNSLLDDLKGRDRILAEMVNHLHHSLAATEGASRRGLLDAELALRAATAAREFSETTRRATNRLTFATWALVLVTAALVLVTVTLSE